jgi:hypothetical protein
MEDKTSKNPRGRRPKYETEEARLEAQREKTKARVQAHRERQKVLKIQSSGEAAIAASSSKYQLGINLITS